MASITWQGFTSFVGNQVTAIQAAANAIIDASVGSVTLAYSQATAGVALWLQAQIAGVLALTRAATSNGPDLDSFYADFSFTRLPAVASTSTATFASFTSITQRVVPIGALISTGPNGVQFQVTRDTTNAAYNAGLGGYVLPIDTSSVTVPIQCLTAGTVGNVLEGTIQSFVSNIVGVDTVTNGADITNGFDAESDPAFRARFPLYLDGLRSSDQAAVESAIINTQQGLSWLIGDGYDYPGTNADPGNFFVIIDDGSGSPPSSLVTAVYNAIYAVRGLTIRFQVNAPTIVAPNIDINVRVASGYISGAVVEAVNSAVVDAVNAFEYPNKTVDPSIYVNTLFVSAIEAAALAVPGCIGVQPGQTKINGSNADLVMTAVQEPRITSENVDVGTY